MFLLQGLFGLLVIDLEFIIFFCWLVVTIALAGSLCCLTTGATVAVALGLAGGFLFVVAFTLLGDSSDSEEYTTDLFFGGILSLFLFSTDVVTTVSVLDFPCLLGGKVVFFFVLSTSDTFWLLAELLEFSESDELDSLPELEELLDEEPELVVEVDSELVVCY